MVISNTGEFTAQKIAKFILSKIVRNKLGIEQMTEELDNNERLVSEVLHFFTETGWIRYYNGSYVITTKCKNIIEQA
jgi:predicted methyltransferase